MELLGAILLTFWAHHFIGEHIQTERASRQRAAAYRNPALAPVVIRSPEFYASLSARYNRPFLGK